MRVSRRELLASATASAAGGLGASGAEGEERRVRLAVSRQCRRTLLPNSQYGSTEKCRALAHLDLDRRGRHAADQKHQAAAAGSQFLGNLEVHLGDADQAGGEARIRRC